MTESISVPVDKKLYSRVLKKVKAKSKVWPSAYASGRVVREYKRLGGKYKYANTNTRTRKKTNTNKFGIISGLTRWFKEKWVNVCTKNTKNTKYSKCARSTKKYPYCRPSVRVNSNTPTTVHEMSSKQIKQLCKIKTNSRRMKNI